MTKQALDTRARPISGPLRPLEIAIVAILSGLTVVAVVVASVIPMAQAAGLLAPVPVAMIAARTRPRAVVAAGVTTTAVTFAVAGLGSALSVLASVVIGGVVGEVKRRGGGLVTLLLVSLLVAPALASVSVLVLWILVPLRNLVLQILHNMIDGIGKAVVTAAESLSRVTGERRDLSGIGDWFGGAADNIVDYWWIWLLGSGALGSFISLVVAWWILGGVIGRLAHIKMQDTLENSRDLTVEEIAAPLPLRMVGVGYRYPGTSAEVLTGIDLTLTRGEFVAVVGANGSGKSTLSKILAGTPPTVGVVDRPGDSGLGKRGGTALVLQRPESQMLGSRVADDLVWGLPPGQDVDVEALLAEVGLAGLGDRETSDLSGGQQQRLAVAAALARDPQLLIADEVTSMVDPQGRLELVQILASLPARRGITVVLITHRDSEARAADRVIHLEAGRVVAHRPEWMAPEAHLPLLPDSAIAAEPLLDIRDVSHTYLAGSPWEVTALHHVDLQVNRGDGMLIVGGNGSGKTTLAWIVAGLIAPTSGEVLLNGEPMTGQIGRIGLGFQHARLQLQKTTVSDEIMAVGGESVGTAEVARVLDLVALPREIAARRVDSLSGGQMRRVVLASLVASKPEVLVLDEPLAGLDPAAREEVLDVLAGLRRGGITIIIISHDLEALDRVCNRRVELTGGVLEARR
ncbi:putative ABC transporter ATP-binding protein [Gordonia hirsuta DSM 44140 = NBRC 16056]|uniref:Putative ABC transporter ATP-binding protein n=1 Tax=Gordonia hirsuta DSM 44140 = NBRC 16056 TaxID=1121927 RepID=L7L9R3_9ACTN|nr:ATP-binding cassette domain-containing protein [Gordonia hirsuta]GAC57664.1 putative ABC transporter ATP-binding protein [Gordonia hirsuta DSM 44140 = NBRC 16056]